MLYDDFAINNNNKNNTMKSPTLQFDMMYISSCSDDDDEDSSLMSGTFSTLSISTQNDHPTPSIMEQPHHFHSTRSPSSLSISFFQHAMENDDNVTKSKNTYFMDGGNRFISVPMLGNTNTKAGSCISRLFEEWLANKLYYQPPPPSLQEEQDDRVYMEQDQQLPILQDSVELLAEDILNKIKASNQWRRKGLDKLLIKVRTGHVYTYHSLDDGQPLITQGMDELFQQFPLFVEFIVYTASSLSSSSFHHHHHHSSSQVLLVVENVTINPGKPYKILEEF
ncbi:hypothetical protein BJ944DRAFT_264355 [Cunninghamella echinulata]|nr:hypothetical protein BJ944DRAFT_264355 [Cunninghamella echinulata]